MTGNQGNWTIDCRIEEDGVRTVAVLKLSVDDGRRLEARGSARRSPADPDVPRVGEDLAMARALSHLSHDLIHEAIERLEEVTHRPAGIRG